MKEMCKTCGNCNYYNHGKCENSISKYYNTSHYSNVVWNCPDFNGELKACDFGKSTLGFGKECSTCEFSCSKRDYSCYCSKHNKPMSERDGCYDYMKKIPKVKNFEKICNLQYEKAIEAIKGTKKVYYKHGVWNPYELVETSAAIKSIKNSSYGADIRYETTEGKYYVSIPCDSDMY